MPAWQAYPRPSTVYLRPCPLTKEPLWKRYEKTIKAVAPKAEECISYRLPDFGLNGKMLVAIGAAANHCAFYPMSDSTVEAFKDE